VSGERGRFGCHSLHQVAIGDDAVGIVVDDVVTRPVVDCGKVRLSDGHAYAVAQARAKWAGGGLDTRCQAELRMARREAAPLAKAFELIQRQIVPRQVQQGVDQH